MNDRLSNKKIYNINDISDKDQFSFDDLHFSWFKKHKSNFDPKIRNSIISTFVSPISKLVNKILFSNSSKVKVFDKKDVLIEIFDGAKLCTDIYFPVKNIPDNIKDMDIEDYLETSEIKLPAILIRTPYWKDSFEFVGYLIAENNCVAIIQDIRGCGKSKPYGTNSFLLTEREDGLETAKWIHNQKWFNGKLAMWGLSYLGLNQWAVSYDNSGLFTCLNPSQSSPMMLWSAHNGLDPYAISLDITQIFHEVAGFEVEQSAKRFSEESTHKKVEKYLLNPKYALYNDPLDESNFSYHIEETRGKTLKNDKKLYMDRLGLDVSEPNFPRFVELLNEMMFKRSVNLHTKFITGMVDFDWKKVTQPMYLLASWYDMFSKVNIDSFMELQKYGPAETVKYSKLVIGPWVHIDANLEFLKNLAPMKFFKYWLLDEKNNLYDTPPVKYYTLNENEWRYSEQWPPKDIKYKKLYLQSKGNANSKSGDGILGWNLDIESDFNNLDDHDDHDDHDDLDDFDEYSSDPMNPIITCGGNHLHLPKGPLEQDSVESREDVLVYTSDIFDGEESQEIIITGDVSAKIYASSDCIDTDFMVKICDVHPNGESYNILQRGIRARYRNGVLRKPELIEPNLIYEYTIELEYTSIKFQKGHKIRVCVYSSDFPKYNINANLGGLGNKGDYIIAHQKIFHTPKYPSHILLPIYTKDEVN